jgi:hypothetical protein
MTAQQAQDQASLTENQATVARLTEVMATSTNASEIEDADWEIYLANLEIADIKVRMADNLINLTETEAQLVTRLEEQELNSQI